MAGLESLNAASPAAATAALFRCCGCAGWASAVAAARPFANDSALLAACEREWARASREDLLEAFSHHPRIGDRESLRARFPSTHAWAANEQSGAASAAESVLDELEQGNRAYEDRFGHIFIVCASGKTAEEMLALLRSRLGNDREAELRIAAAEQMKITRHRIAKLLEEGIDREIAS
jgi:2-oxo-4-hydroxy-4-carboxy-5-ureidoimidazoline decarboxylase